MFHCHEYWQWHWQLSPQQQLKGSWQLEGGEGRRNDETVRLALSARQSMLIERRLEGSSIGTQKRSLAFQLVFNVELLPTTVTKFLNPRRILLDLICNAVLVGPATKSVHEGWGCENGARNSRFCFWENWTKTVQVQVDVWKRITANARKPEVSLSYITRSVYLRRGLAKFQQVQLQDIAQVPLIQI